MPNVVRKLTGADAAAFQALRLQGLRECPSAFASSYEEECDLTLSVVAERLEAHDDRAVFGAFSDQGLIGVLGLAHESHRKLAHKAYMWGMYVDPAHRKSGVGRALVAEALSSASSEMQVRQVNLGANARNDAAIALYEAMGFAAYGREPCFMLIDGVAHDEIHMVRVLDGHPPLLRTAQ